MKTIFTLFLALLFSASAFAYDEGKLTVTFAARTDVQVVIDGKAYQQQDNSIVLNNLRAGNHSIRIYKARRGNSGRSANNRSELLYSANVQVRPSYHVDVMVNRFGKALIDEQPIRNDRWGNDDWYGNGNNGNSNGGYDNSTNRAMSQYDYDAFVTHIKGQWFSGKLTAAREGLNRNYFTAAQVKGVLQLFSTDSDKLELAKLAYRNVVDQRSFYQLYDVFSFQSSRDDLERYVREFRY